MKYVPPYGSADPDAAYVDAAPRQEGSALTGACIEHPMREIVNVITAAGLTPTDTNLAQLSEAVQNLIDKSHSAHATLIVNPEHSGHLPAFGSAPQNAAPILNASGSVAWQVGVTPVYLNQAFDFHAYYAENFYGVVGPDVPGTWVNMPPCLKSNGSLYGGFFDVKTEPAGSAVLRYTIWESGPFHGIEYVCTRQTGIKVWSEWQHNGWQPDYSRAVTRSVPMQDSLFIMPYSGYVIARLAADVNAGRETYLYINRGGTNELVAHIYWNGNYTVENVFTVPVRQGDGVWAQGSGVKMFKTIPCLGEQA